MRPDSLFKTILDMLNSIGIDNLVHFSPSKSFYLYNIVVILFSVRTKMKRRDFSITLFFFNGGGKFLKKLWCCVGGRV